MGVGTFRAMVRGRRSGCNAFLGSLMPKCYDCDVEREGPTGDGWEMLVSGSTKYAFFLPEYGAMGRYAPVALPDDPEEARRLGAARRDALSLSIQARSSLFAVEVMLTQTDDEDREEDGDTLAYVHYVRGEKQGDCWGDAYPRCLGMPVGGGD